MEERKREAERGLRFFTWGQRAIPIDKLLISVPVCRHV